MKQLEVGVGEDVIETIRVKDGKIYRVIPVDEKGKPIVGPFPNDGVYRPSGKKEKQESRDIGRVVDKKV